MARAPPAPVGAPDLDLGLLFARADEPVLRPDDLGVVVVAPEPEAPVATPEFEELSSDELVATLAAGGSLTFEPDDDDLLPGAKLPEAPVVAEATPDEVAETIARINAEAEAEA